MASLPLGESSCPLLFWGAKPKAHVSSPGQGSNPHHSSDRSHSHDIAWSLTHWATRELLMSSKLSTLPRWLNHLDFFSVEGPVEDVLCALESAGSISVEALVLGSGRALASEIRIFKFFPTSPCSYFTRWFKCLAHHSRSKCWIIVVILLTLLLLLLLLLFRASPTTYGDLQARGPFGATGCRPTPQLQQCRIQASSATYTTAHGSTRSLTHWARPGIETAPSWFLVRFVYAVSRQELPYLLY